MKKCILCGEEQLLVEKNSTVAGKVYYRCAVEFPCLDRWGKLPERNEDAVTYFTRHETEDGK